MISRGIQQLRKGTNRKQYVSTSKLLCAHFTLSLPTLYSHSAPALQPLCSHSTSDPTEKGNGNSALYLIIYSLFRRILASIAKTIVLTILRFLDFAFAR